jgi:hypothetical protein
MRDHAATPTTRRLPLLLLLLAAAITPTLARRAGGGFGGGGFSRSRPVSSGYGYRPTFTPAAAPFRPPSTGATTGRIPGGAAVPMAGGAAGAASALGRGGRSSTSLVVPFALGAGSGLLISSALRSGQRCGDGRLVCYREACAQAQGMCAGARGLPLARAPCPIGFAECWAAGGAGGSGGAAFVCNGKANPSGPSDVQASCVSNGEDEEGEDGLLPGAAARSGAGGRGGAVAAAAMAAASAVLLLV